jgi:hypothetical protein
MAAWPIKFTEGSKSTENKKAKMSSADILAFLFSVDLDPSVNLIGHAAIKEMIKLQFTTITDRIRNKIRNGNISFMAAWPIKFTEGSKSTENKKAKMSAYEKERRPGCSFNRKWKDKMNKQMTT